MDLTGLISHWKLDEASGNALDSHGSNTLTETSGTIASATGKVGNCRDFEVGDTEYFTIADNTALSAGDIDFTIAGWINIEAKNNDGVSFQVIAAKSNTSTNQREWTILFDNGSIAADRFVLQVSKDGTSGANATAVVANNLGSPSVATWYYVIAWHDSVNNLIGIQVNNGTANTAAHTTGVFNGTAAFCIGDRAAAAAPWDGLIDEVSFWKRLLTADEKTTLYNGGNGLAYPWATGGPHSLVDGGLINRGLVNSGLVA